MCVQKCLSFTKINANVQIMIFIQSLLAVADQDYSSYSVRTRKVNSLKSWMYVRKKQMKLKATIHSHTALVK